MLTSPRRIGPAIRLALARRPWIRWLVVGATALGVGVLVLGQLRAVDDARRAWTDQRSVLVAARDHEPGDVLVVETRRLPVAAVPESALDIEQIGAVARQRVGAGEVVTAFDVTTGVGPASIAEGGDVVVAISDPLLADAGASLSVGLPVAVHSDGIVLAADSRIVAVDGPVVFVAVATADAASVSAAAQRRAASIAFLS